MHCVQRADAVGSGGEAWIGYKQDLRPCQFGLMLSLEPSFSVFYQGKPVTEFCEAVLTKNAFKPWTWQADQLNPQEQKVVSKELKGLVVRTLSHFVTVLNIVGRVCLVPDACAVWQASSAVYRSRSRCARC
jgi:Argonaute linker 1 domain